MVIQACTELEESRRMAEAELAALDAREERVRELEADRAVLVASCAEVVPEGWTASGVRSAKASTDVAAAIIYLTQVPTMLRNVHDCCTA
jgi:hypothetical protein